MRDEKEIISMIRKWIEAFRVRSMDDWKRFIKASGLSYPQLGLLTHLYFSGKRGVHDIGDHMDITSAAASQLVERLVQAGLVQRTESAEDRRVRQIALTDKGRALVERGIEDRHRWVERLVSGLTPEQREAVLKALPILLEAEGKLEEVKGAADRIVPAASRQ